MQRWINSLRQPSGGFVMHEDGELDIRCVEVRFTVSSTSLTYQPCPPQGRLLRGEHICHVQPGHQVPLPQHCAVDRPVRRRSQVTI